MKIDRFNLNLKLKIILIYRFLQKQKIMIMRVILFFVFLGIPEMNLPAIEPFFVPEINLGQKLVNGEFSMGFKNMKIYGLSKFKILDLK